MMIMILERTFGDNEYFNGDYDDGKISHSGTHFRIKVCFLFFLFCLSMSHFLLSFFESRSRSQSLARGG